jgi:hypothetical protein
LGIGILDFGFLRRRGTSRCSGRFPSAEKKRIHRRGAEDAEKRQRISEAGVPSQRGWLCNTRRCPFPAGLRPAAHLRLMSSGKASFPGRRPAQRARVVDAGWNGHLGRAGTGTPPQLSKKSIDGSGPSPLSDFTARRLDVHKYDSAPVPSSFADRAHSRRDAAYGRSRIARKTIRGLAFEDP